jgi:flagellin-like hook-associated protein FlgL
MAVSLGRNLLSIKAQSSLGRTASIVDTTFQRLSSGSRINKASDDAAGLAISSMLNFKSRLLSQGARNLQEGLSAINIAEAALDGLSNILGRIEELSVQAANGVYSNAQRSMMQQEASALQAEWNRTVQSTSFNGRALLIGGGTRLDLQAGGVSNNPLTVQFGRGALPDAQDNAAGETARLSTTSSGAEGADTSGEASISADGRYVVFTSASNLVPADSNGVGDIYRKDRLTGVTTRISTDSAGGQGDAASGNASISADGRYVAFQSSASNLVAGDTNGATDIFVKDTSTGTTTRVSTSSSGSEGDGFATDASISADGRYVAFVANAADLVAGDTNGVADVFVKDMLTGTTTRVNTSGSGTQGNQAASNPSISADGRYVAFESTASDLVAGDTNNQSDIFVKDTLTGEITRVSSSSSGTQGNQASSKASISADGRYVAFQSTASNLVAGDTNGSADIFIKDTHTGVTTRVSTDGSGVQGDQGSSEASISADGRYVVFESAASNLVAEDTNSATDLFIKDTQTGSVIRFGMGSASPYSAAISADGRSVAFTSGAASLVAGDTNANEDVFLFDSAKAGVQPLAGVVISNQASAKATMNLLQNYKTDIAQFRAQLGASTSRIMTAINNIQSAREIYAGASSRIVDADVGMESATLIAATTRQQVTTALLAQANIQPQMALQLLRQV